MSELKCASCGAMVRESDAYFGAHGQVCGACHSQDAEADSDRFREAADPANNLPHAAFDGDLHRTSADASGTTRTLTIHAGPLGVIIKLVLALFRRLTRKEATD